MLKLFKKINKDYLFYFILIFYMALMLVLSNYRDMINDETLYFHETYLISELFKNREWIGNYGVGVHGFLFKIPPALIFLISGPSVKVVTIYNILLSGLVGILSYRLFSYVFKNKYYGLLSTMLLICNFHFILSVPTYLREIPSLLVILLFLTHIIKGKGNDVILSLIFLLMLDVKEYIFFVFALFYVIWLFLISKEKGILKKTWDVFKKSVFIFLPSLIWIILMFTTPLIPVNMFLASLVGLKDTSFSYLISHFETQISTMNLLEGGRQIPLIIIKESWPIFVKLLASFGNKLLSYTGKILYPRVFSFLSVPKVVIFPVICASIITLKKFIKTKDGKFRKYALLSLLILVWVLVYILRASHGRYLLPVVPAISAMYIYLVFKQKVSKKQEVFILLGTIIYVLLGFYFEASYVLEKIIIESVIYLLFLLSILKPRICILKFLLILSIFGSSLGTSFLFSYTQGQIYGYTNFGENRRIREVQSLLSPNGKYWINNGANQVLLSSLNEEGYLSPTWRWKLKDIVPKKDLLKSYEEKRNFSFSIKDIKDFREEILKEEIVEIVLITTEVESDFYGYQEWLDIFLEQEWLELTKEKELKNMKVYIFDVRK